MSVASTTRVAPAAARETNFGRQAGAAESNQSLLLPPTPHASSGVALDNLSALFQLMSAQRDTGAANEQVQIRGDKDKRDVELRQMFEAKRKEAKARSGLGFGASLGKLFGDVVTNVVTLKPGRVFTGTAQNLKDIGESPKFWSDLAKGAALVTKVAAAVVATATLVTGPGAVGGVAFAAACVSLVAMAEGEIDVLGRAGVDSKVTCGIRAGTAVATLAMGSGAGLSAAAGGVSKGAQAATQGSKAVATATTLRKVTDAGLQTGKVLEPAGKAAQNAALSVEAVHVRRAESYRADGQAHGFAKDDANRALETHLRASIESMENTEKILDLIQKTIAARSQTTLSLAGAIGGRA